MERRDFLESALLGATSLLISPTTFAASNSRLIVGFPPGGMVDSAARALIQPVASQLNSDFIVDNRPGAGGRVAVGIVKTAMADGNVLLITPSAMMVIYPHLYPDLDYNAFSLAPITTVTNIYKVLAVANSHPARTLEDFIEWAKLQRRSITIGTPGAGSGPHFVGIIFGRQVHGDFRFVHYLGDPPIWQNVMGGIIDAGAATLVTSTPLHLGGKIRILAVTSPERSAQLPDVPTFDELGHKIQADEWLGVFAPPKTPETKLAEINHAIQAALVTPSVKSAFAKLGIEGSGSSIEELQFLLKRDNDYWKNLIKDLNFKLGS